MGTPARSHLGKPQCNGNYVEQDNPTSGVRSRCTLAGKGIGYWEYISKVFALDAAIDYAPPVRRRGLSMDAQRGTGGGDRRAQ
ncbi:hypothetical protein EFR01_57320 [Sinorhizobium fredii]|nr:hypothetical protein EFR01_57320 [Sinorhizobium fredii]GLS07206.1 hypothetical protein GCM10007864_08320 [Sinorhizobium fredii]